MAAPGPTEFTLPKIYPNPTNGMLYIDQEMEGHGKRLTMRNQLGQVVMSEAMGGERVMEVDMTQLPDGMYFLEIWNGHQFANGRVVLQR